MSAMTHRGLGGAAGAVETSPPPALTEVQASGLCDIMLRVSGVRIDAAKRSFLELRVGRRLQATGAADFDAYLAHLRGPSGAAERQNLAEALVTHTTSFFRERAHFDWLAQEGIDQVVASGAGRSWPLTVWSAACSTGAEMWSAAMVLDQAARSRAGGLRWAVVGTDISRRILQRAATAIFTEDEIEGLPETFRRRYLMRSRAGRRPLYRIVPELRAQARLAWANLSEPARGPALTADIAFLRNVLLYFPPSEQPMIAAGVVGRLRPGGYLVTGHAEGLSRVPQGLRQVAPTLYRKEGP